MSAESCFPNDSIPLSGRLGCHWRGCGALSFRLCTDPPAGFEIERDGTYSLDLSDEAYAMGSEDDLQILTIPLSVRNGSGLSSLALLKIRISGVESPIARYKCHPMAESTDGRISGQLKSQGVNRYIPLETVPPGFTIESTGHYLIDPSAYTDHEPLSELENRECSALVELSGDTGSVTTIRLSGTMAVVSGLALVTHFRISRLSCAGSTLTGVLNRTKAGTSSFSAYLDSGVELPGFTMDQYGRYEFDPSVSFYGLRTGGLAIISLSVMTRESQTEAIDSLLKLKITGTNAALNVVSEEIVAPSFQENLIHGEIPIPQAKLKPSMAYHSVEAIAGFSLERNGCFTFDPNDFAYENLGPMDCTISLEYLEVTDHANTTAWVRAQFMVCGTHSAPTASVCFQGIEDGNEPPLTGRLSGIDPMTGAVRKYRLATHPPTGFSLDPGGEFTFNYSDTSYLGMLPGDMRLLSIPIIGFSNEHRFHSLIIIKIEGSRNRSVLQLQVIGCCDDEDRVLIGQLAMTEYGAIVEPYYRIASEIPAGFTLEADGQFTFNPCVAEYGDLNGGEQQQIRTLFEVMDVISVRSRGLVNILLTGSDLFPAVDIEMIVREGSEGQDLFELLSINEEVLNDISSGCTPDPMLVTTPLRSAISTGKVDNGMSPSLIFERSKEELLHLNAGSGIELKGLSLPQERGAKMTLIAWVKLGQVKSWMSLAGTGSYALVLLHRKLGFNTGRGDLFGAEVADLHDGHWHQIIAIFTNGDLNCNALYLDAVEVPLYQIYGRPVRERTNIAAGQGRFHLGRLEGQMAPYPFVGSFGWVQLFRGQLTEEIIQIHFQEQRPRIS